MQKHLTESHELLAQAVREFIAAEITPHISACEAAHTCPTAIFARMGEMGFLGVTFPEKYGGSAMDFWAAVVVSRELAYANCSGLALSLFAHTYLAPPLILAVGSEAQRENYLVPALQGKKIGGIALTEPNGGSDLGSIRTTATLQGDNYVINGSKTYITNGSIADFVLVACRTGEGYDMTLFLIDTNTAGFSTQTIDNKLGMHTSDTAELFFDNCIVPKTAVLGKPHQGFYYIMNNFQEERLLGVISGMYVAEAAYNAALQYATERVAFGKPIAQLQAIRHKLASMKTRLEACKSFGFRATEAFIAEGAGAVGIISMAKAFVCESIQTIIYDALQIHGGNGFVEDYGVARMMRDMRLFTIGGGTTEIMYEIIAKIEIDKVQHKNQSAVGSR
jgi:alkylation response protein AidB-like acyl-CoA dehydrogenase